jgi:hypothetical protein
MIESELSIWAVQNPAITAFLGQSAADTANKVFSAFYFSFLPKSGSYVLPCRTHPFSSLTVFDSYVHRRTANLQGFARRIGMHIRAIPLALVLLMVGRAGAADPVESATIALQDRVVIASQIYSAVQMYFGHWKGVPRLDLEAEYAHYIRQVIASNSRHDFDLASIEFLATLQNGHSGFGDKWLRDQFGQMIGFYAYPIEEQWVVTRSSIRDLGIGETITAIDDQPFESFYQRNRKYIAASDERWRRRSFFEGTYLFPPSFTVTLKNGRKVSVTRKGEFRWPGSEYHSIETSQRDGVAIVRIPAFAPSLFENSVVDFLKKLGPVKALVLDLRGNHGGSTPINLVAALMDRPYRWAAESTPATLAVSSLGHVEQAHRAHLGQRPGVAFRPSLFGTAVHPDRRRLLLSLRGLGDAFQGQPSGDHSWGTNRRKHWTTLLVQFCERYGFFSKHQALVLPRGITV